MFRPWGSYLGVGGVQDAHPVFSPHSNKMTLGQLSRRGWTLMEH